MDGAVAAARDLMERTNGEPALGKLRVKLRHAERQDRARRASTGLDPGDLGPQGKKRAVRLRGGHGLRNGMSKDMFRVCSPGGVGSQGSATDLLWTACRHTGSKRGDHGFRDDVENS